MGRPKNSTIARRINLSKSASHKWNNRIVDDQAPTEAENSQKISNVLEIILTGSTTKSSGMIVAKRNPLGHAKSTTATVHCRQMLCRRREHTFKQCYNYQLFWNIKLATGTKKKFWTTGFWQCEAGGGCGGAFRLSPTLTLDESARKSPYDNPTTSSRIRSIRHSLVTHYCSNCSWVSHTWGKWPGVPVGWPDTCEIGKSPVPE